MGLDRAISQIDQSTIIDSLNVIEIGENLINQRDGNAAGDTRDSSPTVGGKKKKEFMGVFKPSEDMGRSESKMFASLANEREEEGGVIS